MSFALGYNKAAFGWNPFDKRPNLAGLQLLFAFHWHFNPGAKQAKETAQRFVSDHVFEQFEYF
jgi:hypothetical protein